jgi:hypothetical protein
MICPVKLANEDSYKFSYSPENSNARQKEAAELPPFIDVSGGPYWAIFATFSCRQRQTCSVSSSSYAKRVKWPVDFMSGAVGRRGLSWVEEEGND